MTNTQHTPGPWEADSDAYVVNEYNRVIADVFINDDDNREERAANARLIAAAPELLAALQAVAEYWDGGPYYNKPGEVEALFRAAIAKATERVN